MGGGRRWIVGIGGRWVGGMMTGSGSDDSSFNWSGGVVVSGTLWRVRVSLEGDRGKGEGSS